MFSRNSVIIIILSCDKSIVLPVYVDMLNSDINFGIGKINQLLLFWNMGTPKTINFHLERMKN